MHFRGLFISGAVLALGCPSSDDTGASGNSTDSSSTSAASTTIESMSGMVDGTASSGPGDPPTSSGPTTTPPTTITATDGTDGTDGTAGTAGTTGEPGTTGDTGGTNPGGLPDGSMCTMDSECFSDSCFVVALLGGICGECTSEDDCAAGGCSPPNPLAGTPATCNMGEIGGGCDTDAACSGGLVCAQILSVPGILTASTCSECETDADCAGQLCAPTYDVPNFGGFKSCVDAGSLPDGAGCDLAGSGDASCNSGLCATASIMGLVNLGVCSECDDNLDCPGGSCMPASVDLATGLSPGVCI